MTKSSDELIRGTAAAPRNASKLTRNKLTRAERNELTRQNLFAAARKVVGRFGYAEASVARITAEAGVAQGTFYNYFVTRQELLDQLLPEIGKDMLRFIHERTRYRVSEAERENDRFRAFFEYLKEVPELMRILNEAELFAPAAYRQHVEAMATSYARLLRRGRAKGEVQPFTDDEMEVMVHMLLGARGYLSQRYAFADGSVTQIPEHVISSYAKLLSGGLFRREPETAQETAVDKKGRRP
ncbi:TetR/AcrR family transcriptional regulator [Xanthobacter oligotrophicus]|uniref:TetR/AcrR family transcriptional regulator n=1 Tax=Xanthobacter oligotrophicus TaxID=2607286 RepID=A0ABW6ZZR6_9HYPH